MKKVFQTLQKLGILHISKEGFPGINPSNKGEPQNKTLEEATHKKKSWALLLIILLLIIFLFFFLLGAITGPENKKNKTSTDKARNSKNTPNHIYQVTSVDGSGTVEGIVSISPREETEHFFVAYYNLHITTDLSQQLVCDGTLFPTEDLCPSVHFYNYTAAIRSNSDEKSTFAARIDPVFCPTGFQDLQNLHETNYGPYINCSSGLRGTKKTNLFYTGIYGSYKSLEEFMEHNIFTVINSAAFTKRETILEGNGSKSIESINTEQAALQGDRVFSVELLFEEK